MYDVRLLITRINRRNNSRIVVLQEYDGVRKFSISVPKSEISFDLDKDHTGRHKRTHDLLFELTKFFSIEVLEVNIKKTDDEFYSTIFYFDGEKTIELSASLSDAIAVALRFCCPIFTSEEIISSSGKNKINDIYSNLNNDELTNMLNYAIEMEDYKKASIIRDVLIKRHS